MLDIQLRTDYIDYCRLDSFSITTRIYVYNRWTAHAPICFHHSEI